MDQRKTITGVSGANHTLWRFGLNRVIFTCVTLLMVSILLLQVATPALADSDESNRQKTARPTPLMIKAPNTIEVGQPLTVTVFTKRSQKTLAGVSVYALKATDPAIAADSKDYTTIAARYEAAAKSAGLFMGITDNNGSVTGELSDSGHYILVAIKDDLTPGVARINAVLAAKKKLNIKAPGSIEVNKPVTIKVYEGFARQPVAGAAVYAQLINALSVRSVGTPGVVSKKAITATPAISQNATAQRRPMVPPGHANVDAVSRYDADIASTGTLLGYTGTDGQLTSTFTSSGVYALAATRDDYKPGMTRIFVRVPNQARLFIKSPGRADVGDNITLTITGRNTGQGTGGAIRSNNKPVEKAMVYAFKTRFKVQPSPVPTENGTASQMITDVITTNTVDIKEAGQLLVQSASQPIQIGYTDSNGQVTYTFNESGTFTLVATKEGYLPGGTRINVRPIR